VIATPLEAPADCGAPLVIDLKRLERLGAHAVRLEAGGTPPDLAVTTERSAVPRPWQASSGVENALSTSASVP
jgi:hypothetical protein